jgi:hypothetical protein
MSASIYKCKDEQILKELCSIFRDANPLHELKEILFEDSLSMEDTFKAISEKFEISKKTSEFILNMKIEHFCSLNEKKIEAAYEAIISENNIFDAANELLEKQNQIYNKIDERAKEAGLYRDGDLEPIYDGVYYKDAKKYLNSKMRIMWVLKEPYDDEYDDGEPCGGGWNYFDCFEPSQSPWKIRTWKNMIYTTYGILNNMQYEEMEIIEDNPEMADVLLEIACINLSKMPGHTTTDSSLLPVYYGTWKDILKQQIDLYSPQVIIFGNTFEYFKEDLFSGETLEPVDNITQVYKKNGVKYIDAYHPQCRIKRETYVNSIINSVL